MKRFGKIAIWSLCFATLSLSCTKVEQSESVQSQISYNVVQCTQTKAAGLYPTTEKFISTAFYLEDGKTWAANHSEAIAYIENATISYDETRTSWHDAAHSYYWPRAGKLTFFSYSPQAIKGSTKIDRNSGITITNWDVNSHQDVDIMIADVQTDQTANQNVGTYTGVPTIFRHALSKISGFTFNLHKDYANGHSSGSYANGDVVFILKSIVIKNMPQKGTYSNTMPSESNIGSWDNASDRAGATMLINEEEVSFIEAENYWSTKNEHYWVANFKYTFFSYSPSSLKDKVDVSKDGVAIYNWDVEADATTEILVADIAKDKTKNESFSGYSGVPTNFRQKLSKLSFNMGISLDAEAGTKVTLLGIKIVGICTQGNYSKGGYTDNAWTVVEASRKKGTSVFTVFSGSKELSTESYFNPDSKLIIPQSLLQSGSYHPTLIVEYQIQVGEGAIETKTAECHFDINLRQESWVMGMEYTYTIHIGVGQYPIEFDGSVDAWNVVNNGEVNIG